MSCSLSVFLDQIRSSKVLRVPGTAVFLGGIRGSAPIALLQHIKHNKALHDTVIILGIHTLRCPFVSDEHRLDVSPLGDGVIQVIAHYGFMEMPNVPDIMEIYVIIKLRISTSMTVPFILEESRAHQHR